MEDYFEKRERNKRAGGFRQRPFRKEREYTPEEKEIIKQVEQRVTEELREKYKPEMLGYIHKFEARKKQILEKEYGIPFETKREKYPDRSFD